MAQPTEYVPTTSFVTYQSQQPWFPGQNIDVEFANVEATTNEIINNLAAIQNDDTTLANGCVGLEQLSASLQTGVVFAFVPQDTLRSVVEGYGSTISTGLNGYLIVPANCTINSVTLLGDQSGSIVLDIWKTNYTAFDSGSTHPATGDKITGSTPPTIVAAKKYTDAALVGWSPLLSAGDVLGLNVTSITSFKRIFFFLNVTRR